MWSFLLDLALKFADSIMTIREGDIIIVCELSRLSRKVKDIFAIVDKIHELGADMPFGREYHQKYIDSTTATHKKSGLP